MSIKDKFLRNLSFVAFVILFNQYLHAGPSLLPPADSAQIKNFVIKSYINILNSKPSKEDVARLCTQFSLYDSFKQNKERLVDSLFNNPGFLKNIVKQYNYEYLQGATPALLHYNIVIFKVLMSDKSAQVPVFAAILDKLLKVREAEKDVVAKSISLPVAQKRFFNNKIYDDINMGSNNFVISTFKYLFFRNPTRYELEEGKKMVDGSDAVLFFRRGKSKEDYLDILFSSQCYIEGQVRYWYNDLLSREPTPTEILPYLTASAPFDMPKLIKSIVLTDEYAGNTESNGETAGAAGLKTKMKAPGGLISIANDDINGTSIPVSKSMQLESSYNACGDKSAIDDLILRSLNKKIANTGHREDTNAAKEDAAYLALISSCPRIAYQRALDPFLLICSVGMAYVDSLDIPFFSAMAKFDEWQKKNAPHSPIGLNNPEKNYLNEDDEIKTDIDHVKKWVKTYPEEYNSTLRYYLTMFDEWCRKEPTKNSSCKDFLIEKNDKFEILDPMQIQSFYTPRIQAEIMFRIVLSPPQNI